MHAGVCAGFGAGGVQLDPAGNDAAADSDQDQIKKAGNHKPMFLFFVIGAAAAVASMIRVFQNFESPDKP